MNGAITDARKHLSVRSKIPFIQQQQCSAVQCSASAVEPVTEPLMFIKCNVITNVVGHGIIIISFQINSILQNPAKETRLCTSITGVSSNRLHCTGLAC